MKAWFNSLLEKSKLRESRQTFPAPGNLSSFLEKGAAFEIADFQQGFKRNQLCYRRLLNQINGDKLSQANL